MINVMTKSLVFKVPIGIAAHNQARQFSLYQANPEKAKQVYLNTLTVWSVKTYLNSLGWQASLETSDSWNPMLQSLMDVADLDIPNCGKLECRGMTLENGWVDIPVEVWSERIGYIIAELNPSLKEAKLLGFVARLNRGKVFLPQLQSLEELPAYLAHRRQQLILPKPIHLSKWLEGIFELSWQQLNQSFLPPVAFSFRSSYQLSVARENSLSNDASVTRVKLIELDSISNSSQIALILNIRDRQEAEIEISVKVCPTYICTHLPHGLEVMILDEEEKPVMQAQAKKTESIEFRFSGEREEKFSIKASLNNFSKVETFVI